MSEQLNVVWLKRDLRLQDHAPLFYAENARIRYMPIYIFEPSALCYPDSSCRHQQFIYHSIVDMNRCLQPFRRSIIVFHAEAIDVFSFLCGKFKNRVDRFVTFFRR